MLVGVVSDGIADEDVVNEGFDVRGVVSDELLEHFLDGVAGESEAEDGADELVLDAVEREAGLVLVLLSDLDLEVEVLAVELGDEPELGDVIGNAADGLGRGRAIADADLVRCAAVCSGTVGVGKVGLSLVLGHYMERVLIVASVRVGRDADEATGQPVADDGPAGLELNAVVSARGDLARSLGDLDMVLGWQLVRELAASVVEALLVLG